MPINLESIVRNTLSIPEYDVNRIDPSFKPTRSINRETIKIIPPDYAHKFVRYEWTCPGCNTSCYGDERKDTIFEIRHDALCCYCRIKAGELKLIGGNFQHITKS